jgi:hypothetical protein
MLPRGTVSAPVGSADESACLPNPASDRLSHFPLCLHAGSMGVPLVEPAPEGCPRTPDSRSIFRTI